MTPHSRKEVDLKLESLLTMQINPTPDTVHLIEFGFATLRQS
jgi:hypothetical protein